MRLLFHPTSLLLALGIPSVVNSFAPPLIFSRRQQSAKNNAILSLSSPQPPMLLLLLPREATSAVATIMASRTTMTMTTTTALSAKKKTGNKAKDAALAALEAMEQQETNASPGSGAGASHSVAAPTVAKKSGTATLDLLLLDDDEPLTKKEQMELEKKRQKEAKKAKQDLERMAAVEMEEIEKNKRKKALKALAEMEAVEKSAGMVVVDDEGVVVNGSEDGALASGGNGGDASQLSKKEAKLAAKKAEKEAEKQALKMKAKEAKKLGISVEELEIRKNENIGEENAESLDSGTTTSASIDGVINGINGHSEEAIALETEPKKNALTAEERIRKERPPPRIRIMESSQPDYAALRLENIAITFRDQPVLKSATWGVQTGDRIGLVGANGAGKTTQLRILAGELEPTAGDIVKSKKDLRVAMLRQEFIDEMDLTRSLREEFMSVFTEEAEIMAQLSQAEKELEMMTGDSADADAMQEVLDRMAKLQVKADAKNVNVLDSRVSKIMDLMGFDPEEGGEFWLLFLFLSLMCRKFHSINVRLVYFIIHCI